MGEDSDSAVDCALRAAFMKAIGRETYDFSHYNREQAVE